MFNLLSASSPGLYRSFVRKKVASRSQAYYPIPRLKRLFLQSTSSIFVFGTATYMFSSGSYAKLSTASWLRTSSGKTVLLGTLTTLECITCLYDQVIDRQMLKNSKVGLNNMSRLRFLLLRSRYPPWQLVFNISVYYLALQHFNVLSLNEDCFKFFLLYLQTRAVSRITSVAVHCLLRSNWRALPKTAKSIGVYLFLSWFLKENKDQNLNIEHSGYTFAIKGETLYRLLIAVEFVGLPLSGYFPKFAFAHEGNIAALVCGWSLAPF